MTTPRWKKILADLWGNKTRSLLVALSIAVGIFAVGLVASSYFIIKQDMAADYFSVNPHTAKIYCEEFGDTLLPKLAGVPGVDAIEARYHQWVKITSPNGKLYPIDIDTVGSLADIQVDQLVFEAGAPTLTEGEIYLERQGAAGLGLKPGDTVDLVLNDGQARTLKIAGTVHDVNANPFKFTNQTSGYVNSATMEDLGGSRLHNYLTLVTSGSHTDPEHIRAIAQVVANRVQARGHEVYTVNINRPGEHPAAAIIDAVLSLMAALGVLAVFLSGFLVTNTITALMSQQTRQIGVMKAIGATAGQMAAMYIGLVLGFGVLALLIAVPLAGLAASGLTRWMIGMLNATPSAFTIHPVSLGLQVAIGLIVPLVGALVPVTSGARITVRQAISSCGISTQANRSLIDRLLESIRGLPHPMLLSLRNAFRRKSRLALTLVTLTLAGAILIGVFGVRESLYIEIDQTQGYYQSDINLNLSSERPLKDLTAAAQKVSGVVSSEGWWTGKVNIFHADGESSDQVILFAPPAETKLINPVMIEGRWLQPADEDAIVLDNHFMSTRPDVKVGDRLQMRMNKENHTFKVVGFFRVAGNSTIALAYVNNEALANIMDRPELVNSLQIVTDRHDQARQDEVARGLQASFKDAKINATIQTGSEILNQTHSRIDLLLYLLLFMAVLIALVGGLGLMGTMSMNVLERTREIGIMRSIGADNGTISNMVVVEGMVVGLVSWVMSLIAAIPLTQLLDNSLVSLMTVPLGFVYSTQGAGIWLGLVLIISMVASLAPALHSVRLTVRDVLAYE